MIPHRRRLMGQGGMYSIPLTFIAREDATFSINKAVEYNIGNGWVSLAANTDTPTIHEGERIKFRGNITPDNDGYTFSATGDFDAIGNPKSMLGGSVNAKPANKAYAFRNVFKNNTHIIDASKMYLNCKHNRAFSSMFNGCSNLIAAPDILSESLGDEACSWMFEYCTSLVHPPKIEAVNVFSNGGTTTRAWGCFISMFHGCTSLLEHPEIKITTIGRRGFDAFCSGCTSLRKADLSSITGGTGADAFCSAFLDCSSLVEARDISVSSADTGGFVKMFNNCTSLTVAPKITVDSGKANCTSMFYHCTSLTTANKITVGSFVSCGCYSMFEGCINLVNVPSNILPANAVGQDGCRAMFKGCTSLVNAPELPATSVGARGYQSMFYGCTSLVNPPLTINATLSQDSCKEMFKGCSALISTPTLPSTSLGTYCYMNMFAGCTSLTKAPALPATTLQIGCYSNMFNGCSSLSSAPSTLPATDLPKECYTQMFRSCTSLVTAPAFTVNSMTGTGACLWMFDGCTLLSNISISLLASRIHENGYFGMFGGTAITVMPDITATQVDKGGCSSMFNNCSALTTLKVLHATTLGESCYANMFDGCIAITTVPSNMLPATTLAKSCYTYMFSGCKGYWDPPILPATILADKCYQYMYNKNHFTYIVNLAVDISADKPMFRMVNYTYEHGGIYVKHIDATWITPEGDNSMVGSSWTIIFYNPSTDKYYLSDKTTECDNHGNVI